MDKALKEFINDIDSEAKKQDCQKLVKLFSDASGFKPYLRGSIIGFGQYHYKYESGREGDCQVTGFSARKQNFALYIMPGFSQYGDVLASLGKYKTGKSCLYINKLGDVDTKLLSQLIKQSVIDMKNKYPVIDSP